MLELAAEQATSKLLQVGELATRQRIPARYLAQMMTALRRDGLIQSIRGPKGGYKLARPAALISVAEVIGCLDGHPTSGRGENHQPFTNGTPEQAVVADLAAELERARLHKLEAISLGELLEQRNNRQSAQTMYFI